MLASDSSRSRAAAQPPTAGLSSARRLALFWGCSLPRRRPSWFHTNRRASANERFMRIFIFKSEAKPDLRAFGGDLRLSIAESVHAMACVGAVAPGQQP